MNEQILSNVKGVGIIIIQQGKILMGKRSDSGQWGLAGGSIEAGETPKEAAIRELYEEFGLKVKYLNYLGKSFSPSNPFKTKDSTDGCSIDFFGEFTIMEKIKININYEMTAYRWIPLEDMDKYLLYPASKYSLQTFKQFIKDHRGY